ncbi:MAG: keto-deoxy-phosphogluconate aldolase, partial [Clostridia bacterium]|nr:keto-deoxy-phosphogluconate aldolase [Clostridia bacterium]
MDYTFLNENKIVPVVVIKNLQDTLPTLEALSRGGIKVAEITFRTECAKDAIELASKTCKDMLIGAGTVINAQQCEQAIGAGAKFVVSPGFSADVLAVCNK